MFCKKCGEKNPDNAIYCRNCGCKLIEDVKKTEVIENQENTTTNPVNNDNSNWMNCCICIIGIFIAFAFISIIFH